MIQDTKKIYLCDLNLNPITELNGVQTSTVNLSTHVKDYDELTFTVDEYIFIDGKQIKSNGYDDLDAYLILYLEDKGMFQMQQPKDTGDGQKNTKDITAYSLEKEWEDKDWQNFKVNTGEKDSLEQLATDNLNELGFAKEFITFCSPNNKELSFLDLILEKLPGWSYDEEDIDPIIKYKKIPSISQDNVNLYNLCVNVIAPRLECLFLFDTIHRKVKVVSKENLDNIKYETGIYISYRNLASHVDITVDEDSIFTRYNCRGDNDLTVLDVNYQDYRILNIDYFLRYPYMSDELIHKVKTWLKAREDNREDYIALSRQWADEKEASSELQYRVPSDDLNIKQWEDMNQEGLKKSLSYYHTLLTSLQVSVDPGWTTDSKDYSSYVPWKKSDGTIDHDKYLKALYDEANGYGGYYTYYDTLHYIIPNIEIAIENLNKPKDQKTDYIKDWETNWNLYGVEELQGQLKKYEQNLDSLKDYSIAWENLTDDEKKKHTNEDAYNLYHKQYVESSDNIEGINKALTERQEEKKVHDDKIAEINTSRNNLAKKVSLNNPDFGFTSGDLITIQSLFHDTDYQNNNILSTSIDTTKTMIDRELELYEDSVSKLSESAQPQYKFSVTMDNLYRIPEFKEWHKDFALLNYIRLGIKDDYSVKVRIIGISYNPCEITSDINIDFSSMITSHSGRTDLTDLINSENYRGSKNSISIGTGNASDSEKEYMTTLLQQMIKMNLFKNAVGNIAGNTTMEIDGAKINTIVTKYLNSATIDVGKITGDEATFRTFFTKYGSLEFANIDFANITKASFENSFSKSGMIENLVVGDQTITGELVGVTISGDLIKGNTVVADKLVIRGEDGLYYKLNTDGSTVEKEQTDYNSLNGQVIMAKSITATKIDVKDLVAFGATIGGFNIGQNSLYSGVKESVDNTTRGIYMDDDGQFSFGDSEQYVKYFKDEDGNYKIDITVENVRLKSSGKTIEEELSDIKEDYGSKISDVNTTIESNSKEISLRIDQTEASLNRRIDSSNSFIGDINGWQMNWDKMIRTVDADVEKYQDYITFQNGDIILGESKSDLKLKLANDSIQFKGTNTDEVVPDPDATAWITGENFNINNGEIHNSLKVGKLQFVPRSNGNFALTII